MNILIISPEIYPCITGGVEIFNYYLIKELANRGHKVCVLTNCEYDWNNKNISIIKLNETFLLNPTLSTICHIFLKLIKLKKKIDVVHVPYTSNSTLAYPVLLAKKFIDIHYIITIHGGGMHPWKPKFFHKLFFKYADEIVAVSEIIKKEYEKRSDRIIKVRGWRASPFFESKISKEELRKLYGFNIDDKLILSLGSIKKIKGSDTLLYAFLELGKTYINKNKLKLIYVGEGSMKFILEEKVKEKDFNEYVKFLGNFSHEEVPNIYKLSDIYIISSLYEGAPQSLLDAMFNGLSIIGTDVNGINNLIKHGKNGLLYEKENIKDLKEKIKKIVEDKDLSNILGKNARKAREFTNNKFEFVISQYIKLYKRMC